MNRNRYLPVFILINLLLCLCNCGGSPESARSYVITVSNEDAGKETVTLKTDRKGTVVYISEQERMAPASKENKPTIIKTKMVVPSGELFPASYSYESGSGVSYSIKSESGSIIRTVEKDDRSEEFITPLEQGMHMLDLTVFHTIEHWIHGYDTANKGGHQTFKTYLLPAGSVENISVSAVVDMSDKEQEYQIRIQDEIDISLLVDKDNRLLQMMFLKGPRISVISSELSDKLKAEEKSAQQEKP